MKKNTSPLFAAQATNWLTRIAPRSLRIRLALWGLLLLGTAQIMVSVVLHSAISTWLEEQVNTNLRLTAVQVSSVIFDPDEPQGSIDIEDVRLQFESSGNIAEESFLGDRFFFVRLVNIIDNTVIANSAGYDIPITRITNGGESFETVWLDETQPLRIYTLPLTYAPDLALQVGISLRETREIQKDVLGILSILLLITGTLAPLSGWFLANRALVPIRAIAQTAAEINETDLSRRLDLASSEIELEQLVQTFNAMLDRIERAFQQQRQFTTDVAHELRTPLSIMQTSLDVTLGRKRSEAEYQAALLSVQEEVQRLSKLAHTLLILARSDTSELILNMTAFDLSLMIITVVEQFIPIAEDKKLTLERDVIPGVVLVGDEARLIQVVFNLIDNAIKFTPSGGLVKIGAHKMDHFVKITIKDTGQGIAEEDQRRIFERFYRTEPSQNRNQGGFGLGLAIAKQVVTLHHGDIRVHSTPQSGAEFVVLLPVEGQTSI
jgi:heavy metal sensor kinase